MMNTKAKYEALVAAYGGEQTQKTGKSTQKNGQPQQVTDTKSKYEALLAVYGDDPKPQATARSTMPTNEQIVAGARQALQKHQSENQQKWNGWQKDAAAKAAAQPTKTGAVTLMEPVILPSAREEAPSLAQLAEQAQRAYDDYLASDEYKAGQLKNQAARGAAMMQGTGVHSSPIAGAGTSMQPDMREVELRAIRDYYKNQYEAEQSRQIMEADLAELETWTEEDRAALETYVNFRQNSVTSGGYAVPAQRAYNMLTAKYGKNRVNEIAYSWQRDQNEKIAQELKESSAEAVEGKTGASILHSAATVPANLLGSVTGVYGTLMDLATRDKRYKTLDPNNVGNLPTVYSGAVRGQVAENISGDQYDEQGNQIKDGGGLRQAASYAYQGLMSSADSLARAAVGSGSKAISLGLAATGSFGQTVSDASQRGATPAQAVLLGVVNGGLEVATEYLPLDEILKVAKGGTVSAKQLFQNIFKQAAIEVTEEETSFLGSVMAESIILLEKSGYRQQIAQAIANGASYEDAMKQANVDAIMEAVETAITSAFSGGFSAGVSSGAANINNMLNQKQQEQKPINPDAHVELADMQVEFERETWDMCDRLAKATGRNIKLYQHYGPGSSAENGYFEDGVIYVNTKSGDPVAQIVSHELTHSVEFAKEYQELSRMVLGRIEAMGGDLKQLRQQKADLYAQEGHPLGSQAEVDQEIVAEYVAKNLLTNEQQIMAVAQQNRTLAEKIKAWVDKLLAAIGNRNAAERTYLTNVQNLYAKALQQPRSVIGTGHTVIENGKNVGAVADSDSTQVQNETTALNDTEELDWNDPVQIRTWAQNMLSSGQITEEEFNGYIDLAEQTAEENAGRETFTEKKHSISSGRRYSFAGPNARTANSQTLAEAKAMDEAGAANETIRQQTGWFKGMDGKWRWEIDDSEMKYSRKGDLGFRSRNSEYDRYRVLTEKAERFMLGWSNEWLSMEEQQELTKLQGTYGNTFRQDGRIAPEALPQNKLGDYIDHHTIYEAYPQLRDAGFVFADLPNGTKGQYDPERNIIRISNELRHAPEDTIIHEIQHAIQEIEGFTGGASVEYWKQQRADIVETIAGARRNLDMWLDDIGYKEIRRDSLLAVSRREKTMEQHWKDMAEFKQNSKYARQIAACEAELAEYQRQYDEITHGMTAYEQYENTAGEIEARDVTSRRNLTEEERKNTPPNLGDEDTVFAEGNMRSDDYIPGNISEQEIESGIQTVSEMNPVTAISGTEFIKEGGNLLNEVNAFFQSIGGQVFNPQLGDVHLTKRGVKDDLAHGMTQNKAASFAAIPDVLRNGSVVGFEKNWKGRGYDSATVAAPITIGEDDYMMAVVVHRSNSENKFYIHDVFTIKEEVTPFITGTQNLGTPGGATSTISIIRKILDVKKKNTNQNPAIEAVPDTGKIGIVSANMNRNGASQVPDENAPSLNVHDELASAPNGIVPSENPAVKRQMSISPTVSRKNVADDLRGILNRGGDVAELRRYISQLERSGGNAERSGRNAYQNGAAAEQSEPQRIISMAKRYGISVDEYLRRNWEQFEVDGQWNEAARKALELERGGRKYSVSESEQNAIEQKTAEQIRQEMPVKARNVLIGAQRKLLTELQNKLGVNKFANLDDLKGIVEEIANAYLTEGHVDQEKVDQLFKLAYDGGIVRDAEFYEQYKEIKSHLRNTAVTISEGDSHDIADFWDFKRRNFGTLRIVKEGGLPVDSAYHELNEMAPELFPESITHPADQLVRMAEVARSIQVSEQNLNAYYGDDQESFRKYARHDFENAVAEIAGDLRQVKRYVEGTTETEEAAPTTPQEAAEYYKQLKDARRAYERVQAKNLLTPRDEMQVGRLLRGEILPEDLDPEKDYVKGITAVFEAKKEYERLSKLIAEYKRTVRAGHRENADKLLETANEWQDKKIGLAYSRETMERNIDDIVPDKEVAKAIKREYFEAVHISEAEATRFKTKFRNRVRGMNLSTKINKGNLVSEAHAVQLLGEAEDNIRVLRESRGRMKMRDGKTMEEWNAVIMDMWKESPGLDQGKIRAAVKEFRTIYDELFQMMNAERVRNGYEPVNYRQSYFPHFQPGQGDGILGAFGKALNIDTSVAALPTTINGLTHTFKPGIQWFGNAQERLGFNTAYDAVEGFDKYIEGVASVIYQTENIQKLRALAGQIRYRTSEEGIRKQVDEIRARDNLSEEEKQVQINSIYEHGRYTLSNFVNELDEYTNLLANKKSKLDRTMEAMIGRKAYAVMKAWEARVGANMIAGNLSSALTNFIPLTQAGAQLDAGSMLKGVRDTLLINTGIWLDKRSLLKGMAATLKAIKEDDGIAGLSSFLTNRKGSDPLVQRWTEKASKKLGMPMELIDGFTSESIVRAAYFQNLKRGMSETEALHQADVFASHVMADRSKGAMPTLFESRNPIFKAFTQFQLEVNNQFSEVFKDLPRGHRERGLEALTLVLLKYFIGAFLYNEVYEYFVGRRAALDPFGILNDTVGDLTGYELPNLVEWGTNAISGKETSFETDKVGIGTAGKNLTSDLLGELPFSSGLTLLGIETDGGRIPASSAVPDLTAVWDAATTEGWSAEKRWKEIQDELDKAAYVAPPLMGNQIGKVWNGIKAYIQGGSYSVDTEGNDILQYPVFKDGGINEAGKSARMALLGKSSIKEAREWVDSGFKSLSAKQTAVYQDMLKAGENDRKAYALVRQIGDAKNGPKFWILDKADVSEESKAIIYYGMLASESEQKLMDDLADVGAEQGEMGKLMIAMKKASQRKGAAKREAQQQALAEATMTDDEKAVVVGSILGTDMLTEKGKPTTYANFLSAVDRGLSVDDFMDMRSKGIDVEEYLEATDAGLNSDDARDLAYSMYELNEDEDTEQVDLWRLAVKSSDVEYTQLALLGGRMNEATFKKAVLAYDLDVSPDMFVTYYEKRDEFDSDGNGDYTQAEVKKVIDAMGKGYTNEQKGVLWQMATDSLSTKNNPYSKSAGQKWLDAKAAAKEKG